MIYYREFGFKKFLTILDKRKKLFLYKNMIDLDKFCEEIRAKEMEQRMIMKKTWHIEYFLFSFNRKMFGFIHHHWFPCGGWEAPNSEYDFDYEKGFQLYDRDYRWDTILCDKDNALFDYKHQMKLKKGKSEWFSKGALKDAKFALRIKCFPLLVYKEECVGWKDEEGEHYYKEMKNAH